MVTIEQLIELAGEAGSGEIHLSNCPRLVEMLVSHGAPIHAGDAGTLKVVEVASIAVGHVHIMASRERPLTATERRARLAALVAA